MTTQEEIDEMFASLLRNISQTCNKTTFVHMSHNIEIIKGEYRDMLQFCKNHHKSLWHSVKDGELPKGIRDDSECMPFIVKTKGGNQYLAYYTSWFDEECRTIRHEFFDECDCALDVEYWMEIPELPTELE